MSLRDKTGVNLIDMSESKVQKNLHISRYKDAFKKAGLSTTVEDEINRIKSGYCRHEIQTIRTTNNPSVKEEIKSNLPVVTWGGKFLGRSTLIEPSGLACMDFDKVGDAKTLKSELSKSKYLFACWTSPSGNGVKALIRIPEVKTKREYTERYLALLEHYKKFSPDSTKDITRLCYTSWDPDLWININCEVFTKRKESKLHLKSSRPPIGDVHEGRTIRKLLSWWRRKYSCAPGSRNNDLFILSCSFSEFGISQNTALELLAAFEQEDFPKSEIQKLVSSAYRKAGFNTQSF